MDIAFKELITKTILIYLDDLTMFSKHKEDHFDHIELVFQKFLEFRVSLNPKKCIFEVLQGKLLGHVASKDGVTIDPDHLMAIKELPLPINKKGVQSFIGKINFVSRFISDFVGIIGPITLMLKKDQYFKWNDQAIEAFEKFKEAISSSSMLVNLDLSKDFIMYVYSGEFIIAMVLTQKGGEGKDECPMAFHSRMLKNY